MYNVDNFTNKHTMNSKFVHAFGMMILKRFLCTERTALNSDLSLLLYLSLLFSFIHILQLLFIVICGVGGALYKNLYKLLVTVYSFVLVVGVCMGVWGEGVVCVWVVCVISYLANTF